jgi:hypothetical protein
MGAEVLDVFGLPVLVSPGSFLVVDAVNTNPGTLTAGFGLFCNAKWGRGPALELEKNVLVAA